MNIDKQQLNIIDKSKNYLEKFSKRGLDISSSANCYFCSFGYTPGQVILKCFQNNKTMLIQKINVFLRSVFAISKLSNYEIYNDKNINSFDKIVVSWATRENFNNNGSYFDKYFQANSKNNKKILWFLISMDNSYPEKLDENIIIFYRKSNNKTNLLFLIKSIFFNLFECKFSFRKYLSSLSYHTFLSKIIYTKIRPLILKDNLKAIIMPYEAQPFQNFIFKNVKKIKKDIKTIGYLHSNHPFPSHNLYRKGAPEKLFVHGSDEKFHLINILNWPEESIKVIPSLRYRKDEKFKLQSIILLPYYFTNANLYLREIKNILSNLGKKKIKPLTIINHPHMTKSTYHIKFIKKLNVLLDAFKNNFSKDSDESENFVLGGSYTVLELLERGSKAIHICAEPIFEAYSSTFWPNILINQVSDHSFIYRLKRVGSCVKLGNSTDEFDKYLI